VLNSHMRSYSSGHALLRRVHDALCPRPRPLGQPPPGWLEAVMMMTGRMMVMIMTGSTMVMIMTGSTMVMIMTGRMIALAMVLMISMGR
jgi:hypothetical protein